MSEDMKCTNENRENECHSERREKYNQTLHFKEKTAQRKQAAQHSQKVNDS